MGLLLQDLVDAFAAVPCLQTMQEYAALLMLQVDPRAAQLRLVHAFAPDAAASWRPGLQAAAYRPAACCRSAAVRGQAGAACLQPPAALHARVCAGRSVAVAGGSLVAPLSGGQAVLMQHPSLATGRSAVQQLGCLHLHCHGSDVPAGLSAADRLHQPQPPPPLLLLLLLPLLLMTTALAALQLLC